MRQPQLGVRQSELRVYGCAPAGGQLRGRVSCGVFLPCRVELADAVPGRAVLRVAWPAESERAVIGRVLLRLAEQLGPEGSVVPGGTLLPDWDRLTSEVCPGNVPGHDGQHERVSMQAMCSRLLLPV